MQLKNMIKKKLQLNTNFIYNTFLFITIKWQCGKFNISDISFWFDNIFQIFDFVEQLLVASRGDKHWVYANIVVL